MPSITANVGDGATNKTHDVALVQAMLRIVKNAKGSPYLAGSYDGSYGGQTKSAIISFQKDNAKVIQAGQKAKEKEGVVDVGGTTLATLAAALPATHKELRIIPNTKTVYLEAASADATASAAAIRGDAEFEATFKTNLAALVDTMFAEYKIALWLTPTGRRRTFAQQAAETKTFAGPGESNHNFGRAADIGFKGFRWIQGDGSIKKDADWLNALHSASASKENALWDARDALAAKIPLFRLNFERVHLQLFDQATFNNPRSLVKLLNTVGKAKWESGYKSDFGLGGAMSPVGTAKQIWAGNATVSKADLAKALSAKTKKVIKEADIKLQQIIDTQKALKADFEAADTNWIKWVKVL
ncbi:MAG: peptidoglycan-binding protein [Acidobacteria bacterium]|nr:peptidoglycan-binding protein [Acidobacteriota bacterium]